PRAPCADSRRRPGCSSPAPPFVAAAGGLCFWVGVNINGLGAPWWRLIIGLAVAILVAAAFAKLFLATARQNYKKHRSKFLSLFVGEASANRTTDIDTPDRDAAEVPGLLEAGDRQPFRPGLDE